MKKIITLFSLVFFIAVLTNAQNASFGWFLAGGGAIGADRSADVVTDADGNIFTANHFLNAATFNSISLTGAVKGSGANYDASLFISKISPAKTTLWTIYSNDGAVTPTSLATSPSGDLFVTGTIRAVVNTAGQTTTANLIDAVGTVTSFTGLGSSVVQSFVAKFNASGVVQWVKEINSSSKSTAITSAALAADADGNVYISGSYISNIIFPGNSTTYTTTNTTKASFITKLNGATGNEVWSRLSSGSIVSEDISALTYGDDGNLYAAAIYRNATSPVLVTIGNASFTPSAGYDLTLIKLNVDGDIAYIQNRSNLSDTRVKDIVVKNGKVFIAGSFKGSIATSTALTSTSTNLNGFTLAFSSTDGSDVWQKNVYSSGITDTDGLAVGNDGNLFAFGAYANKTGTSTAVDVDFGNSKKIADTDPTNNAADLFLVSYNANNGTTAELHKVASSSTWETANSLVASGNKLYLLGTTNGNPITFQNSGTYSTLGAYDFFLASYTVTNPGTGYDDNSVAQVNAYFNKDENAITIQNAGNIVSVKLYDATGKLLKLTKEKNDVLIINTQGITQGAYFLHLSTVDGKVISEKIIIR